MKLNLESTSGKPGEIASFSALGGRLTWAVAGPPALLGILYGIVSGGAGWLTRLDVGFALVVGLMLLGRWVEHRSGTATTLSGDAAGANHFRWYATILIPVAAAAWIIAKVVRNYMLN
jgi:hypothetical protein